MLGLGGGVHNTSEKVPFSNRYALTFNGTDEYVQLDPFNGLNANDGTFSAWVIWNSTTPSAQLFHARVDSNNLFQVFWHNSADEIRFVRKAGGTAQVVTYEADQGDDDPIFGDNFPHSTVVHVAMTWDKTADELKGYINGTQVGSTVSSLATFSGTIANADIGQNTQGSAFFKGRVDEVSIWTDVMSISALYNKGVQRDVREDSDLDNSKLLAYYQFEEGTGTTVEDASGNGNTGTLVNTPTWTAV
jgi:hypothetical protein